MSVQQLNNQPLNSDGTLEHIREEYGVCPSCGEPTWGLRAKGAPVHLIWCSNLFCDYRERR